MMYDRWGIEGYISFYEIYHHTNPFDAFDDGIKDNSVHWMKFRMNRIVKTEDSGKCNTASWEFH